MPTAPPRFRASTCRTSTRSGCPPRTASASRATSARSSRSSPSYLLEHARRHDYALLTRPDVDLESDERLRLGEFGIQTRLVKPPGAPGRGARAGRAGPHDGLQRAAEGHEVAASAARRRTSPRPRRSSRSTIAATSSTGRSRSWAARASATACSTTRTSRGATPSSAAGPPATGRSSTSARPTGSRSTGDRCDASRLGPGDEVVLGTVRFVFDIEQ